MEHNHRTWLCKEALSAIYYRGEGVDQDYTQALKWYRKAADQGDAFAQNFLHLDAHSCTTVPRTLLPNDYGDALSSLAESS